jgi:predicted glutamine amidotransferase
MMAVVGSPTAAQRLLVPFRQEARVGKVLPMMQPGHADGWGITYADPHGALHHAGRSTRSALDDPAYPEAVARVAAAGERTVVLAHVRKMTKGRLILEHTHPFIRGGLALAHNGTVHGLAPEGESDSSALLSRLVAEREKGATVEDAIVTLARDVDRNHRYSSLTLLVTDGRALWGLRRVGNDPVACAPEQCAPDYYTLGHARLPDGGVVVSQEHEPLGVSGWTPVEDGGLLAVAPDGRVTTRRAL